MLFFSLQFVCFTLNCNALKLVISYQFFTIMIAAIKLISDSLSTKTSTKNQLSSKLGHGSLSNNHTIDSHPLRSEPSCCDSRHINKEVTKL